MHRIAGFRQPLPPQAAVLVFGLLAIAMTAGLVIHSGPFPARNESARPPADAYGKLPLSFVPNRGQTDARVRFYAQGAGHAFYFTPDKAVLSLTKGKRGVALQLTPLGATSHARLEAVDRAPGKVSYIGGRERHANLPTYREVAYRDLWPGIDLVFRGRGGTLKYEFHVSPGADPSRIGLAYRGADGVSVAAGGSLLIQTPLGTLRDKRPDSFQRVHGRRVPVDSRFALRKAGHGYGFGVGAYDPHRPLVIDPGLVYSTYLGGSSSVGSDAGLAITADTTGHAYVAGVTGSTNFPTTAGAFDTTIDPGSSDVFVTKMSVAGTAAVYSTYLGGGSTDQGLGVAVDGTGSAYVTGYTDSSDFPTTAGAFDTINDDRDAFVSKLDADGSALAYSTFLGGADEEESTEIAVDGVGNAHVTGYTDSLDFPTTLGAFDNVHDNRDAFVTKLDGAGAALVYSTSLGGTGGETGHDLTLDGDGNAYVTGETNSADFPTTAGVFDTTVSGTDAFVTKLDATGSTLGYSTYLGGNVTDVGYGIAVNAAGSAYLTGITSSATFPTTAGAFDTTLGGIQDAFVTRLDAAGLTLAYSTYLGGNGNELAPGGGIAVDGAGSAYVTGTTGSQDFPTSAAAFDTAPAADGRTDVFVSKVNAGGFALTFSTLMGGDPPDQGRDITVGAAGAAYATGLTASVDFPVTPGAFDTSYNGGIDGFVSKLDTSASPGYPRPRFATRLRVPLVPAQEPCDAANVQHGPPLELGSCNPPQQESDYLTIGTPDVPGNAKPAASVGSLALRTTAGNPVTTIDEADVALAASITDVRNLSDLTDYEGELRAGLLLQVTDRYNGAAKSDPATGENAQFAFTVPCTATPGPADIGSTCSVATSADAVMPGAVREGVRTIWAIGAVEVMDGGADGDADTTEDNTVFARQGVFVP